MATITPFADRLLRARKDAGMMQADLAKRLGVSTSAVGQWEVGLTQPSRRNLTKLAEVLGVKAAWLLGEVGSGKTSEEPPEVVAVDPISLPEEQRAFLAPILKGHDLYRLQTDIMAGANIHRGDLLVVDLQATPKARSVVLAAHRGQLVLRVFFPPYLQAITLGGTPPRYLTVDNVDTVIKGVMIQALK